MKRPRLWSQEEVLYFLLGGGRKFPFFKSFSHLDGSPFWAHCQTSRLWAFCLHTGYNCRRHKYTHTRLHRKTLLGIWPTGADHTLLKGRGTCSACGFPYPQDSGRQGPQALKNSKMSNWMKNYKKPRLLCLNLVKVQVEQTKTHQTSGKQSKQTAVFSCKARWWVLSWVVGCMRRHSWATGAYARDDNLMSLWNPS